jgi:glycosyltransferase involved in cell wall biosynthesis
LKVAVVIPVFNKEPYLRACLESVQAQTLQDISIVCVDDASTDGSLDVLQDVARRDPRVRVVRHSENRGAGEARNTGLSTVTDAFVQFTDADDLLPTDALKTLSTLAVSTSAPVVRGSLANLLGSDIQADDAQTMADRYSIALADEPKIWVPYFHVCYLFETSFLSRYGLRYPRRMENGEDPVFLAGALAHAPAISTTSEVTYIYRRMTRKPPTLRNALDFVSHIRQVKDIYSSTGHAECWRQGVSAFYRTDLDSLRTAAALSASDGAAVDRAAAEVWPAHARHE